MPLELYAQYLKLPVFALVAARLGGLLMFQPILGALSIPTTIRALGVLALAALMTPLVGLPADAPTAPARIAVALGWEILLGGLIGLVLVLCFAGLQLGGLIIAQQTGIAFGQVVDPTSDEEETAVGVFYVQLAAVVYLALGGHRALVAACLDTFRTVPLLGLAPGASAGAAVDVLCQALTLSLQVAFRVAGPALLALFLVDLALGFISRTMPQLNVLAVGFSVKTLVAFSVMAAALPTALDAFVASVSQALEWVTKLTNG